MLRAKSPGTRARHQMQILLAMRPRHSEPRGATPAPAGVLTRMAWPGLRAAWVPGSSCPGGSPDRPALEETREAGGRTRKVGGGGRFLIRVPPLPSQGPKAPPPAPPLPQLSRAPARGHWSPAPSEAPLPLLSSSPMAAVCLYTHQIFGRPLVGAI